MGDANPKAKTKRRSVSKARLYKELVNAAKDHGLGLEDTIGTLMDEIKNDIVTEALK